MPQHHAGHGLHLHVVHALALDLCKMANLLLRKLNVFNFPCRQAFHRFFNLALRQTKVGRIPIVKFLAVGAHRFVTTRLYVFQNAFHCAAHRSVGIGFGLGIFALFEVADHGLKISISIN